MDDDPGPRSFSDKTSIDRARSRAQSMFRSMLLVFACGFGAFALVAFIVTKEIAAAILVIFIFLGIAVCGWLGQRWLLRNMGDG